MSFPSELFENLEEIITVITLLYRRFPTFTDQTMVKVPIPLIRLLAYRSCHTVTPASVGGWTRHFSVLSIFIYNCKCLRIRKTTTLIHDLFLSDGIEMLYKWMQKLFSYLLKLSSNLPKILQERHLTPLIPDLHSFADVEMNWKFRSFTCWNYIWISKKV